MQRKHDYPFMLWQVMPRFHFFSFSIVENNEKPYYIIFFYGKKFEFL